ncbi:MULTISPECIES: DUF2968 domain-containing protein [Paraburkholderia]|jgi:hypothetical protein|uniref:DUF2968 domain-containing protein n=1 Tax=Paraburkholderia TaxID=1822464 RepID=UPI001CAD966B|nr:MULTISPECIES: DUF2968 domain-containing protein [Paraburkholderia]GJH02044.1 DUF2968 domain-containing protein [Paraburkholderia terrae]CAG9268422.1 conserved exported hypothetical protein [Paraburkholderia caribensis]
MKYPLDLRRMASLTLACALMHGGVALAASKSAAGAGVVSAGAAKVASADAPDTRIDAGAAEDMASAPGLDPNADTGGSVQGDVADLMQLIHDGGLTEMRTTYNGGYGASLFFHAQSMTYYVALFQEKHFWRVIRTSDQGRAESIYAGFARQTAQLADVEIRRTQLQAQKASIERVIGESQARAQRLQADIEVARAQEAKVADYQRQTQDETLALRDEKDKAQAQLRQLQQQVLQLQRQAEAGLPGNR